MVTEPDAVLAAPAAAAPPITLRSREQNGLEEQDQREVLSRWLIEKKKQGTDVLRGNN